MVGWLGLAAGVALAPTTDRAALVRAERRGPALGDDADVVAAFDDELLDAAAAMHDQLLDAVALAELDQTPGTPDGAVYGCLLPDKPPLGQKYEELSEGLCKIDIPRRTEFPTEARVCERMCMSDVNCTAYFTTQAEDCVHYHERNIIPGGAKVEGGHCWKKVKQFEKSNIPGAKPVHTGTVVVHVGEGLCKMVPRLPAYQMCHNQTEAPCKRLCDSRTECFGFTHVPVEDKCVLYNEPDLRGGTKAHNGAKCFWKVEKEGPNTAISRAQASMAR